MDKIWTNTDGGDRLIAFINPTLYKANPRDGQMSEMVRCLQEKQPTNAFALPLSYIREIALQEGKDYIQIFFKKDSEEHLKIKNPGLREEIFNFLKDNIPNSRYYLEKYSRLKAAKKPLIALAVVLALSLLTLYFRLMLQQGTQFEVHGAGLASITYFLATLSPAKSISIFGGFGAIAFLAAITKARNPPVIHRVILPRSAPSAPPPPSRG